MLHKACTSLERFLSVMYIDTVLHTVHQGSDSAITGDRNFSTPAQLCVSNVHVVVS